MTDNRPCNSSAPYCRIDPIITLDCGCCGQIARGRQWYNQDTGYGLCQSCAIWLEPKTSAEERHSCYGVMGHHYSVQEEP